MVGGEGGPEGRLVVVVESVIALPADVGLGDPVSPEAGCDVAMAAAGGEDVERAVVPILNGFIGDFDEGLRPELTPPGEVGGVDVGDAGFADLLEAGDGGLKIV